MPHFFKTAFSSLLLGFLVSACAETTTQQSLSMAPVKSTADSSLLAINDAYVEAAIGGIQNGVQALNNSLAGRRANFERIKLNIVNSARVYQEKVATVRAELQVGATPGNPQLMDLLASAQGALSGLEDHVGQLREFAYSINRDQSQARFLMEAVKHAMNIQGGNAQQRDMLQDLGLQVSKSSQNLQGLRGDVDRLSDYQMRLQVAHREDLELLTRSVRDGVNAPIASTMPLTAAPVDQEPTPRAQMRTSSTVTTPTATEVQSVAVLMPEGGAAALTGKTRLVTIRDAQDVTTYKEGLYDAIAKAYAKNPDITFTVAGMTPLGVSANETASHTRQAQNDIEHVLKTLVELGVPTDRVTVEVYPSAEISAHQVQVYEN